MEMSILFNTKGKKSQSDIGTIVQKTHAQPVPPLPFTSVSEGMLSLHPGACRPSRWAETFAALQVNMVLHRRKVPSRPRVSMANIAPRNAVEPSVTTSKRRLSIKRRGDTRSSEHAAQWWPTESSWRRRCGMVSLRRRSRLRKS